MLNSLIIAIIFARTVSGSRKAKVYASLTYVVRKVRYEIVLYLRQETNEIA